MKEQYYLTAERFEELKTELVNLKTVRRLEVADRLKRAKELGDLSENAEYSEAREEQAVVESRIFEVEDMTYHIVGSNETKPEDGYISNESPLGKAFLGKKPGEDVTVTTPKGDVKYSIVKIG